MKKMRKNFVDWRYLGINKFGYKYVAEFENEASFRNDNMINVIWIIYDIEGYRIIVFSFQKHLYMW